jgi:tRNA(Ile)-lysidine synthetase-like protein
MRGRYCFGRCRVGRLRSAEREPEGPYNGKVDAEALRGRIEEHVRRHDLIPPGGEILCLVSGGSDSTCLWHALGALGYRVDALHVNHKLRGEESEEDARFCRERLGAEIVEAPGTTEADLRELRYSFSTDRLRATGHTASDQVETVLYRLISSGRPGGIKARREDGVVRPLLTVWREETEEYCRAESLPFRRDSSNPETKRGLIRAEVLPLLRRLDPRADENLRALADEPPRLPRGFEETLRGLLASRAGSKQVDLGSGLRAVREYDRVALESGGVRWGPWTIEADADGLEVRSWQPGDRLAGRTKKVQDLFVDAKVARSERSRWPVVVRGEDVVAVPGIAVAPGWEDAVTARREE